ncbi:MAG TPA: hypothetical protein VKR82_16280 [Candidatus Acidoferrales bacterium]|nr:hypothetical protein [Candidatus Acidoferrales bacterium]
MLFDQWSVGNTSMILRKLSFAVLLLLLVVCPSVATAQCMAATDAADLAAIYPGTPQNPNPPSTYPLTSDRYAVQYRVDGGNWTDSRVYISIYGGTTASPFQPSTKYAAYPNTSMSFVSIPAHPNANVQLRVTKRWDGSFLASDHVYVRPAAKGIPSVLMPDGTVEIFRRTAPNFAGEQFILWWGRSATEGGAIQGLVFFLNPEYGAPTGNVKLINSTADLVDVSTYDTLDFESPIAFDKGTDVEGAGAQVYQVPVNINTIFLGPKAWVQGKFRFEQSNASHVRRIYGPGVLDGSLFNYAYRQCRLFDDHRADGLESISVDGTPEYPDHLVLDGIIEWDNDFSALAILSAGIVNNVKILGWNGNNDAFRMGAGTTASNVFVRAGDDSLELWGPSVTVTNATVWQNASGGVVNLGWLNIYPGDFDLVDGLYVVRTDWPDPTPDPSWKADEKDLLAHQDNGVIVSLMVPGTIFGHVQPPIYRNIFVDEAPRVLFSLKILPPDCDLAGLKVSGGCPAIDLTLPSEVNLKIENLFTPQSIIQSSIGFQILPAGFTYDFPAGNKIKVPADFTLTGKMNINMTNVFLMQPNGSWAPLTSNDANSVGNIRTNGENVNIDYNLNLAALLSLFTTKLP